MKNIENLLIGEVFRPAHPEQLSYNGKKMFRNKYYRVVHRFPMKPNLTVAEDLEGKEGKFTLEPGVRTLTMHEPPPDKFEIELEQLGPIPDREYTIGLEFAIPLEQSKIDTLSEKSRLACQILHTVGYRGYRFEQIKKILDANWRVFGWPLRKRSFDKIYAEVQKAGVMLPMKEEKPEKARYLYYWGKEVEDDQQSKEIGGLRDVRQGRKRHPSVDDLVKESSDDEVES